MTPKRQSIPLVVAIAGMLVATGSVSCGGSKKSANEAGNGSVTHGNGDGDSSTNTDTSSSTDPGARLVEMVGQIAADVEAAGDCDQFASALSAWTKRHQAEFEKLVAEVQAAAESGEAGADAAQMDAQIVEGYLAVVEAAAECGDNEDAMSAYEAFNATVEKATY
jgi:hypothetical protein